MSKSRGSEPVKNSRSASLVRKAVSAAVAAIEIYNKPAFNYREETFAILMINAWELLLKARILKENNNKLRFIELWEKSPKIPGKRGPLKSIPKQNRSGNNFTIGLQRATEIVRLYKRNNIDGVCIKNLEILVEIRDNAIHFENKSLSLRKELQEVGSAALKNFAYAASTWFGITLEDYNFSIMPVAFETPEGVIKTVFSDKEKGAAKRVLTLISDQQKAHPFDPTRPFNVGVKIEMRFVRTATPEAILVKVDPTAPGGIPLVVSEEDVLAAYPWRYADFIKALKRRYSDFKINSKFVKIKKSFENEQKYCRERRLDPKNAKSAKQKFYNPNIVREFDVHYTKKVISIEA